VGNFGAGRPATDEVMRRWILSDAGQAAIDRDIVPCHPLNREAALTLTPARLRPMARSTAFAASLISFTMKPDWPSSITSGTDPRGKATRSRMPCFGCSRPYMPQAAWIYRQVASCNRMMHSSETKAMSMRNEALPQSTEVHATNEERELAEQPNAGWRLPLESESPFGATP
jgi:hypothetical protein